MATIPGQVPDRVVRGIPPLVEEASWQATQSASSAASSAESASQSEQAALQHASDAQAAAEQAEAWATSEPTVYIAYEEPPEPNPGTVWFQTQSAESNVIGQIKRFDASAAGNGLFPSSSTWPGSTTYPNKMGDWFNYTLAQTLVTS